MSRERRKRNEQPPIVTSGHHSASLPTKMGQKSLNAEGTSDEDERLASFLSEYKNLLSTERKTIRKNLSVTEYCPQNGGKLLLKVQKGGHWNNYGHTERGQTYLYPEEALYLQECGVMEIVSTEGGPWTIQKAYHRFLSGNKSQLQYYQVYADLKRAGYIVQRAIDESYSSLPSSHSLLLLVYKPQKTFKRSSPGPPHSVVMVTSPEDCFPLPSKVRQLKEKFPQSQIQYSVVNGNDISYYAVHCLTSLQLNS